MGNSQNGVLQCFIYCLLLLMQIKNSGNAICDIYSRITIVI